MIRLIKYYLFFFILTYSLGYSQVVEDVKPEELEEDSVEIIAAADTNLVDEIEANEAIYIPKYEFIPEFTNEQIKDRLGCAENEIKLTYNPKINSFIDFFVRRRRDYSIMVLQRKNLYFPLFERLLKEYKLPDELKYLAIVESGLKARAISPSSAVGLWQFIPSTGRHYGLRIDSYIDERLNPEKATIAACKYLKWLHGVFGDWQLALASYNCGPGYVTKARVRAGIKGDFWQIYNHLPAETRSYVPQFIAISYLMHYSEEHNLFPQYHDAEILSDTVIIDGYCDLNTMARMLEICPEDINNLNVELKRNVIPEYLKGYALKLPIDVVQKFRRHRETILDSCGQQKPTYLIAKSTRFENSFSLNEKTEKVKVKETKFYHTVKKGENLIKIASKYGVTLTQIKKWNHLSSSKIRFGQKLLIHGKNYSSVTTKHDSNTKRNTTTPQKPNVSTRQNSKFHVVKKGETLYQISRKYGISVNELKDLNNLGSSDIKFGQKLKVN
ncbi:MAG: LysM peptidoglycan-binding domain-containing protein [Cytophagales bacterium]